MAFAGAFALLTAGALKERAMPPRLRRAFEQSGEARSTFDPRPHAR
jgi:hypothetical protein